MKAQTQQIFNVIVGVLLLGFIFIFFLFFSDRLGDLEERTIADQQSLDLADSFVPAISQMNAREYQDFLSITDEYKKKSS